MNKAIIKFVISAFLGFGVGYLVFGVIMGDSSKQPETAQAEPKQETAAPSEEKKTETPKQTAAVDENNILAGKGCLGCHAVESLGLQGGATGPDLSKAFENVADKHGKPIDEFLKEPTSAVMSSVIGGSPLSDEERQQIVDLLKQASEK